MSPELISILALAVMFVIATVVPVNMGVLAFVGAFLVGTVVADLPTKDIIGGFPGGLFLTLVGITFLFAIAQNNGTIDWLVDLAVRAVRGRVAAIPWIMFFSLRRSRQSARSVLARWQSSRRSRWASPSSTRSTR
jgi:Kef-type K+ transport system membrane component KefB